MISALARIWPFVDPPLRRMLMDRGVDPATAQDVSQATAERVITSGVAYESAEDLLPWATTVAKRLVTDGWRRTGRVEAAEEEIPDHPSPLDVTALVEDRLLLEAVSRALPSMLPADQETFAHAVADIPASSRQERMYWNLRRYRARKRLAELLDGLVCAVVALRHRLFPVERLLTPVAAAGLVALAVLAGLWDPPPPVRPSVDLAFPPVQPWSPRAVEHPTPQPAAARRSPATVDPPATAKPPSGGSHLVGNKTVRADSPTRHYVQVDLTQGDEPEPLLCLKHFIVIEKLCLG